MADPRYRYAPPPPPTRRSPPLYNPARASMPTTTTGYTTSMYGGDMVMPPAHHHDALVTRPVEDYRRDPGHIPTTTYGIRKDTLPRSASVKETSSRDPRSITGETSSKRPIIVTTKHTSGNPPGTIRSGSPTRDPYRSSDEGQYYTQPASSIGRSKSTSRPGFSATMDDIEYQRLKDRTEHDRLMNPRPPAAADQYRSTRPTVLYTDSRRGPTEFDDTAYEYTKPADLARYDLDHDRPRRRRDSIDRYYRPTVSVTTDLSARPYEQNERRQRGPPPTTWGLDRLNRQPAGGIYNGAGVPIPIPPQVPLAPEHGRRPGHGETPRSPERRDSSRPRPISLIQDTSSRPSHHDDYYRAREEELIQRELRERDRDREREFFQDGSVASRGFGIRVEGDPEDLRQPEPQHRDDYRERREPRTFEDHRLQKRSYDDLDLLRRRDRDRDYELDRRAHRDDRDLRDDGYVRDKRSGSGKDSEDDRDSRKLRDKVAAGVGIAAASMGLVPGKDDKDDRSDTSSSRRRRDKEADRRKDDDGRSKAGRKEPLLGDEDFEIIDHPMSRDLNRVRREDSMQVEVGDSARDRERDRDLGRFRREDSLQVEVGNSSLERNDINGDSANGSRRDNSSPADGDEVPTTRRRHRASSVFNPNDTASLELLKAQLAAQEEREKAKDIPVFRETSPERKSSAVEDLAADVGSLAISDESRGRELAVPARDEKQVRVVSPPREKEEKKPIKGILKQPKPQFPEEPNPVREGVAPHKDDKTKADVPQGARWTKISRKMVNPEALTIGKERFEVRDDFVIVLRVLSKEEIQEYAAATAQLRERRRKEYEREKKEARGEEFEPEEEEEKRKRHRQHRIEREGDDRPEPRDREKERERHRRHRHESEEDEYRRGEYYGHGHGHHRR